MKYILSKNLNYHEITYDLTIPNGLWDEGYSFTNFYNQDTFERLLKNKRRDSKHISNFGNTFLLISSVFNSLNKKNLFEK